MNSPNHSPTIEIINSSKREKAYLWLAGFIDGEGYIGILRQRKKENHRHSASLLYHPYLIISNNNLKVLQYIKRLIGYGYIHKKPNKEPNSRQQTSFQYKLARMDHLEAALKTMQPFFRLKQKQCKLLLAFIDSRKNAKRISGRGSRGIASYSKKDEEIYQKLRILNKRGT